MDTVRERSKAGCCPEHGEFCSLVVRACCPACPTSQPVGHTTATDQSALDRHHRDLVAQYAAESERASRRVRRLQVMRAARPPR